MEKDGKEKIGKNGKDGNGGSGAGSNSDSQVMKTTPKKSWKYINNKKNCDQLQDN
jgi:hypothetical protein